MSARTWLLSILLMLGCVAGAAAHSTIIQFTELDPASALAQKAVTVALPEFERHGFRIEDFDTTVARLDYSGGDSSISVLFQRKGRPSSLRGSSDEYPSLEVRLDSSATQVVNSHFSR